MSSSLDELKYFTIYLSQPVFTFPRMSFPCVPRLSWTARNSDVVVFHLFIIRRAHPLRPQVGHSHSSMALTLSTPGLPHTIGSSYFVTQNYWSQAHSIRLSPDRSPYLTRSKTPKVVKMPVLNKVYTPIPFPFLELPNEAVYVVASFILNDQDLLSFSRASQFTHAVVFAASSPVWKDRFATLYDPSPESDRMVIKHVYMARSVCLRKGASMPIMQEFYLRVIADVALEAVPSFIIHSELRPSAKNFDFLEIFVHRCLAFRQFPGTLLHRALHLLLSHYIVQLPDQYVEGTCLASIRAVYAHPDMAPIFSEDKMQPDLNIMVHILNIFRKHITVSYEITLYDIFQQLSAEMKPMPWSRQLTLPFDPLHLSGRYLGDYGSLEPSDVILVRSQILPDESVIDHMGCAEKGHLQALELDFSLMELSSPTNNIIELTLRPDLGVEYSRFTGKGYDEHLKPFICAGIIHDLTDLTASTSIPGWKRIAMVQRCNISPLDYDFSDRKTFFDGDLDANCWTLEGLIVPGGHIILGKYTNTLLAAMLDHDMLEVGPFMFWRDYS